MKIYGQTPLSIFKKIPWPYKILVTVGSIFVLFVIVYVPVLLLSNVTAPDEPSALRIGDAGGSAFDPSLAYDPITNKAYLAYVTQAPASADGGTLIQVKLAEANDASCKQWRGIDGGFTSKVDDLLAPDSQTVLTRGVWRVETPSLVYDAGDAGREWKLFAYKYFWPNNADYALKIARRYGMIVYQTAASPLGPWSTEQWLFSAAADYPPPPYQDMIGQKLSTLHPDLKDIKIFSRPSVIVAQNKLYMTLSAFVDQGTTPDRVILLSSADRGQKWQYVATLLQKNKLPQPFTVLAGATLLQDKAGVYLAAVLGDTNQVGQGSFIYPFTDLSRGVLATAPVQKLPLNSLSPNATGGGFAAYTQNCAAGILTAEEGPTGFQIFKTYQHLSP